MPKALGWTRQTRTPLVGLLAADCITWLGNGITMVAVPLYVLARTHSAVDAGVAGAASTVPLIIAGVAGGVFIDRRDLRQSSILADFAAGLLTLAGTLFDQLGMLPMPCLIAPLYSKR